MRLGILFVLCLVCYVKSKSQTFLAGETYFSTDNYIEYLAGNLPIVISAPHGGTLEPGSIPDRDCSGCVYTRDSFTEELTREVRATIIERTACYPHTIINRLHRRKLDANRAIANAADGNPAAEVAWTAFQAFIDSAKSIVNRQYGKGLFLDMHGHGHDIQRIELGYLMSRDELAFNDNALQTTAFIERSSIRHLAQNNLDQLQFASLLRGEKSFGALLTDKGFASIPSLSDPFPINDEPYFTGGYNTRRHGSRDGGSIDGIQIECNRNIRFDEATRQRFADSLANVILDYLETHYFPSFSTTFCNAAVAVDPVKTASIHILPNPFQQFLQFESTLFPLEVEIYSSFGQKLRSKLIRQNLSPMDVLNLPAGIYFVKASHNGKLVIAKKMVKTVN